MTSTHTKKSVFGLCTSLKMLLKEAAAHFLFSGHNFQEKRQ